MTRNVTPNYKHSSIPAPGRLVPGTALVLDGETVKLRLMAERTASKTHVHTDWLRFTIRRRNVVPTMDSLPEWNPRKRRTFQDHLDTIEYGSEKYDYLSAPAQQIVIRSFVESFQKDHIDPEFVGTLNEAHGLGRDVIKALGPTFTLSEEIGKGQDFYKYRLPILLNGSECGWIGFIASSDGPRQQAQNQTIHVNLFGAACTFAQAGWNKKMADVIDLHRGDITRIDHALDFFDGFNSGYGMKDILADYDGGKMDHLGRRPKPEMVGNWTANGHSRSFYWGSKEAGKQTNAYEKGDQLYGHEARNPWIRFELRWGNKHRVLGTDMLRRPADFFAGASDFHAHLLDSAQAQYQSQNVPCEQRLPVETVTAEVHRVGMWVRETAGACVAACFRFMSFDDFLSICNWEQHKAPGRLRTFAPEQLREAFAAAGKTFSNSVGVFGPPLPTAAQLAY